MELIHESRDMVEQIRMLIKPVICVSLTEYIQTSENEAAYSVLGLADQEVPDSVFCLAVIGPGDYVCK
jgi:hypothetical protein